jgi:carbon starvation protein
MLAFATFVYDTLDVATRLGRYLMEELFGLRSWKSRLIATAVTLFLPFLYVVFSPRIAIGGKATALWASIWPLFGSSNQLLAALTLTLMMLWLGRNGEKKTWIVWPALFMFVTSGSALVIQLNASLRNLWSQGLSLPGMFNSVVSIALLLVAILFLGCCLRSRKPSACALLSLVVFSQA